jgi:holdfast attachment protein HfaA
MVALRIKPRKSAKIGAHGFPRRWHGHCFFAPQTNFVTDFSGALLRLFVLTAAGLAFAGSAFADPIARAGDFSRPFGMSNSFDAPFDPSTRDANGNRVIVDGRIQIEGSLSGGLMDGFGSGLGGDSATAIGNQLNVVTNGSYNTVIVDSTQINNGDISADINGAE